MSPDPYSLGDPATPVGRVRPFPASMVTHLVRSLVNKATGALTVLVAVDSAAQAGIVRSLEGSALFNIHHPKGGGYIAESVGLPCPVQVVVVGSPDHPLLVAAARRPAPANTGTVIVTNEPLQRTSALAELEQQREAVRYQLDQAL